MPSLSQRACRHGGLSYEFAVIPAQHFEEVVKRVEEAMPGMEPTRLFSMANRIIAEACLVEIANYRSGKLKISVPP